MQTDKLLCGRYRLREFVGGGGMADVYLAFDEKRQTPLAIKVLREETAEDPHLLRGFRREAEALRKLDHPNIVRFYAFEQDGDTAFIVMDYVDGSTLRRRLKEQGGPLPLKEITSIVRDVCAALNYAHLGEIVHRDLKPGNVMLKRDGTALLTDFGIARPIAGATMTQVISGTPAYMSPEQFQGAQPDARSDIYSLGILLFELATGRRPFTGEESELTATDKTARLQEAHLRVPAPDPRSLNRSLPPAAAAVILRCLEKDPAARWPDAVSVRRAWEEAVGATNTHTAVRTAEVERPPHVGGPAKRGPSKAFFILPAILVLAIIAIVAVFLTARGPSTGQVSPAPAAGATQEVAAAAITPAGGAIAVADTPTPTAGPTDSPSAAQPGAKGGVRGAAPTATPRRTATKAPSATTGAAPTATPRPEPATATTQPDTPTPKPTRPPAVSGVTLLRPPPGVKAGQTIQFAWKPEGGFALEPGASYELIIWGLGEDPRKDGRSPVGAGTATSVEANLPGVEAALGLRLAQWYCWGVRLWDANGPGRMLSEGRSFLYDGANGTFDSPIAPLPANACRF